MSTRIIELQSGRAVFCNGTTEEVFGPIMHDVDAALLFESYATEVFNVDDVKRIDLLTLRCLWGQFVSNHLKRCNYCGCFTVRKLYCDGLCADLHAHVTS